jgi:hypothetical protein
MKCLLQTSPLQTSALQRAFELAPTIPCQNNVVEKQGIGKLLHFAPLSDLCYHLNI